jgi:DNA-binding response OmpR family regulator
MGGSKVSKRILIVDDEPHIRRLLEETLEDYVDEGVEILAAKNGREALESIKKYNPNLVYLDVMMPEMNGYDVCRHVKKELKKQDVYIVLLTAKGQEFDKSKGIEVGADMYITKPFDPDHIFEISGNILGIKV